MKRLAPAIFLLFYTFFALGAPAERTANWAAERKQEFKHFSSKPGLHASASRKHSPHQSQTKLVEDGSVLVSLFVRFFHPPDSESDLHHRLSQTVATQNGRSISSRAPPTIL
jgi:hypothetical protein